MGILSRIIGRKDATNAQRRLKQARYNVEDYYDINSPKGRKQFLEQRIFAEKESREKQRVLQYKEADRQARIRKTVGGRLAALQKRITAKQVQRQRVDPRTGRTIWYTQTVARGSTPIRNFGRKKQAYQGKKGHAGRGRPSGSYKYRMPDGRPVDVFTWRRYVSQQRAIAKQNYQMQMARNPQMAQQFNQQAPQGVPIQQAGNTVRAPNAYIKSPDYEQFPKDLHVWEGGNAVGLDNPIQQQSGYFNEIDLMSGKTKIRKQGSLM
jgi:hypothetical protein